MSKDRKLSKAEIRRLERFEETSKQLLENGYISKDITADALKANLVGPLYGLILSVPFIILFILINGVKSFEISDKYFSNYTIFMILLFVMIVVHELIHGFTWSLFTKNKFKSIEFGVIWSSLNPYCTCAEPLSKKQYFMGLLMPFIVLGVIPCIISLFNHNAWFLAMGVIMMVSAGGDLLIGKLLLKEKSSADSLYYDHPTNIGLICFEKAQNNL